MSGWDLGFRLAAEFPAGARQRGWYLGNLVLSEGTTIYGGPVWSVDVCGPTSIDVEWHYYSGMASPASTHRLGTGIVGTVQAATPDGLLEQVRIVVDALGLRDLKAPKPATPDMLERAADAVAEALGS